MQKNKKDTVGGNKAIFVSSECHKMVRTVVAIQGGSLKEWCEKILRAGYEKEVKQGIGR